MGNTIGNTIINTIGTTISNTISNTIHNPTILYDQEVIKNYTPHFEYVATRYPKYRPFIR